MAKINYYKIRSQKTSTKYRLKNVQPRTDPTLYCTHRQQFYTTLQLYGSITLIHVNITHVYITT